MKKHLLLLLGALIALNSYAYDFRFDGIYYNKDSAANNVTVTFGDDEYSGDIVIPESVNYDGKIYSVTEIGEDAFSYCSGMTSVTIGNSVTKIGDQAFSGCSGMTSVTIGNSVTKIGDQAFSGCSGMTSVVIGNSVTYIGSGAFSGCIGLTEITVAEGNQNFASENGVLFNKNKSILLSYPEGKTDAYTIPNSVIKIGYEAFSGCIGLTSVTIPNSVTEIDESAFSRCIGLTSVTIGNSVTYIGSGAFYGCSGLTEITVAEGNQNFASENGVLFNKDKSILLSYPEGKTGAYTIPSSVTKIGYEAFSGCSGLTSVTFPNSVTEIDESAFSRCIGLTSVTIGNSVTYIGSGAFSRCSGLTLVTIPNSVTIIADFAFRGCSSLTSVTYLAEQPVSGWRDVFSDEVYENATLNYLKSAEEKIASTEPWHRFKNRIGRDADFKDDSSISEVWNPEGETTAVYDMRGVKVGSSTEGLPKGIYIERRGSATRKIAVR